MKLKEFFGWCVETWFHGNGEAPALARRFVPSQSILNERAPLAPEVLLDAKPDNGPMTPRRARAVRYGKVARDS